jgi:diguanylate cyclase (GGDEF)-like protein
MTLLTVVVAIAAATALSAVVFALRASRLQAQARSAESRGASLEKDLAAARRQSAQAEADQQFLARVVRELPHVAHELHGGAGGRQIPALVLGALIRLFEPRKAVVLVRRRQAESDPERHTRLAVAAVHPPTLAEPGAEVPIGVGEIGYAAEVQRVMDRREFENQPPPTRRRLREETFAGFQPDVVAPMIFNEQVVGVLALEGPRGGSAAKDALRLLAQIGAVSVHTQARYTEMKATAAIDGLTGIFNKRYLTHRLAEELRRSRDEVSPLSLFLFDLDHFKHYNDRNGHVAGDRLLQSLARLVQENVRKDSVFGRYGGEEFVVLFPGARRAQALAAADNVRRAIATHEFAFGFDQPLGFVSVSGGVAECPEDGSDAATLVRAADEALYRAKEEGRNRVLAYAPTYLGEGEAQEQTEPVLGSADVALALAAATGAAGGESADHTPAPGTLLSLASITPAGGVPRLALESLEAALAAAAASREDPAIPASPGAGEGLVVVEQGNGEKP